MNKTLPFIFGFAVLHAVAQAQTIPPAVAEPAPPPAPVPPIDAQVAPPATVGQTAVSPRPTPRNKRNEAKPPTVRSVVGQVGTQNSEGSSSAKVGGDGPEVTVVRSGRAVNLDALLPRSTRTGRTLVAFSTDPDPSAIANAEEDLSVMALILRKATGGPRGEDKRMALGIEVDSTVFGSSSGARNIYLEGYGALFLLGVRFPLVAPPDKPEEAKTKETTSSDWAQAREEYLNEGRGGFDQEFERFERVWKGTARAAAEEYDADKVEELKSALLDALKNATHIRALKPDDYVTVVIQGAETARADKPAGRAGNTYRSTAGNRSDPRHSETVMTLRVKKSEVDAFAKGSLDPAGFRKKVAVQTYLRRGDSPVSTSVYFAPGPGQ